MHRKLARETREGERATGRAQIEGAADHLAGGSTHVAGCEQIDTRWPDGGSPRRRLRRAGSVRGGATGSRRWAHIFTKPSPQSVARLSRLIRIGQDGECNAACVLPALEASAAVARSLKVSREDAGWFDPLLELASMRHEHASERLFIS